MKVAPNLHVEHPNLTIGQVVELGQRGDLRRSSHIGNQPLRELALMSSVAVRPVLVDTITGNDNYSNPAYIIAGGTRHRLASQKHDSRVVGSVPLVPERYTQLQGAHPELKELGDHEGVASLHTVSLEALNLAAQRSITATGMLASMGEAGGALMEELSTRGSLRRAVRPDGKISSIVADAQTLLKGVFGIEDHTPQSEGIMLPLEGMMAMDILAGLRDGRDTIAHAAGTDMRVYTRNAELMGHVGDLVAATQQRLGERATTAAYVVVDITGLDAAVHPDYAHVASQYDLILRTTNTAERRVPLAPNAYDMPAYTPMEI